MRLTKILLLFGAGWCFSRIFLSFFRFQSLGEFAVLPGFYLATLLIFIVTFRVTHLSGVDRITPFILGVCTDALPFWFLRPGMGAPYTVSNTWDIGLVFSSVTLSLFFAGVLFFSDLFNKSGAKKSGINPSLSPFWFSIPFILTILLFRTSYALTKHLPNEERSIFIQGFEVHHANWGILGIMIIAALGPSGLRFNKITLMLISILSAFFLDQFSYLQLNLVSDEAYEGLISLAGAVFSGLVYMIYANILLKRR